MPSKSSGRIVKSRKNSTTHQKNHRFESFNAKIAKFNSLQPLRKVRRHDLDAEDLSATTSYFRNGLQKWSELNIAKCFVSFKREVLPLTESLPQILHFQKKIMESLAKHISMHEKESLEPLLDLLTAFAHDLGARFEVYYARSLELIVGIAGKPQDVDVIEWTFGSLAFLFKYLSKLLVPNLRPTFDAVVPLLGKARHPPHIAKFAAEALSFLVKKAGAPSHRETALPTYIRHVKNDLCSVAGDRQFTLYRDGVMTMFAEAMKGNENTIHSSGTAIFLALMDAAAKEGTDEATIANNDIWTDVNCGVLTSIIHHSTPETFEELQTAILERIASNYEDLSDDGKWWNLRQYMRILGVIGGVRKGSRVTDWSGLVQAVVDILQVISKADEESGHDQNTIWNDLMSPVAMIFHHAPVDALIPKLATFSRVLEKGPLMRWYIPFNSYVCDLDAGRFSSLLKGQFQKFVAGHWSQEENQDVLCVLLPRMIDQYGFPPAGQKDSFRLPQDWQDQIVSKFENLEISPFPERGPYDKDPQVWRDRCLPKYSALLRLLELATVHPSTNARIAELLIRKLKLALRPSSSLASDEVNFIVSQGFRAYLRMAKPGDSVDITLGPLLRAAVPRFARSVGFLEAYLAYEEYLQGREDAGAHNAPSSDSSNTDEDPAIVSLVENLGSPSHEIRLASLKLLKQMNNLHGAHEFVDIMIDVEELPLSLENTRTISMLLRKLGQKYSTLDESSWLQKGVPNFAFGMLTVKLAPVWDNATEALVDMAQTKAGEEAVCEIAFRWLDVPSPKWSPPSGDGSANNRPVVTDFDCTWLQRLQKQSEGVYKTVQEAHNLMLKSFDERQSTAEVIAANARSRALKVLNAMPSVAERRSKRLVPHFLPWALEDDTAMQDEVIGLDETYWSLYDRKALLEIFSQFINPKMLYQHERVYDGVLLLLENGDVEVQKLALKTILTWKQTGVKPYQENLEYLLDDSRFKNELTVFLQGDGHIKTEHRQELMPVLLRLLYGRTISKKGAASGKNGLQATRSAVLRNLSVEDMGQFLEIASGKLRNVKVVGPSSARAKLFDQPITPPRKQLGYLNMVSALISELGTNVTPYMDTLVNSVLYTLVFACRKLRGTSSDDDEQQEEDLEQASTESLLKSARTTGIKSLIMLFQNAQEFSWDAYHDIIVEEVVASRLDNLPNEMTQGISGILQLLSTWSALPRTALFLGPHENSIPDGLLPKIIECLAAEKAKDDVRIFILGMIQNLVRLALAPAEESEFNELIKSELLEPNAAALLNTIAGILQTSTTSPHLLDPCVETMLSLTQVLQEPESVDAVLRICSHLLLQPPRKVNPRTKGRVLLVVENFVALINPSDHKELCDDVYATLASLFSYFKDRENRQALCRAVAAISVADAGKTAVAELCSKLNTYAERRIDQPDYDTRLSAFSAISQAKDIAFTPQEWLPLLHNALFFIKDDQEFGVLSTNSADVLRRFVQDTADNASTATGDKYQELMKAILLPAIFSGAREPSETVRRETLRVLGFLLCKMPQWEPVKDMSGLLGELHEDSTEPLFFFNLLSPAVSRQLEALQALEEANLTSEMASQNIAQFFIPLLENFLFVRTEGTDDRGLSAQATSVIGSLAGSLHWKHYRTTLLRYIGYVGSRPDQQRQTIRLLGKFTDALSAAAENRPAETMDVDQEDATSSSVRRLSLTMPKQDQLTTEIVDAFLPMLVKYLHEKDESEVSYRVPVGVTIVKLLKLLAEDLMTQKLAGVLTDICHILRSKNTESRDLARDTLVEIARILGSSYFGFILRELKGALTKGYQLHVLSYTMHSILVAVIPDFMPGDLDYCLSTIVSVIMDDIFGVIGQEKDADGYITQMKEVKSSKSQDSMELIARTASITHLIEMVRPLQALLMQKVDLKMIRKIDNLLGRIAVGLLQNAAAESRDTLIFCYEVIQNVYKSREPQVEQKLDLKVRKYLVQKGAKRSGDRGQTVKNTFRLLRFAIDVLRSMFKKHDSLRTPENLTGFLPILGDAILEGEDEVKISAFRLLAVIVKVPFEGDEGTNIYKVAVKEATKSVSMSISTTTDISQAALKMLAVVLRDRKDVVIKDAAVDMLLGKLKDDLTEPQYRHVTFNFLRSILERHVETSEVYDIMDYVGTVMITNDDKDTRDLARGAFFQFIREYPQRKARWAKQLNFIVANLQYKREGGRLSVMEVIHLLLVKSSDEFVQEIAATCFLPLFLVMANDESEKCCLAAAELVKEIFSRANKERTQKFLDLLRNWMDKDDNMAVQRLALRIWSYYFESNDGATNNQKDFKLVFAKVTGILSVDNVREAEGELVEAALGLINVLLGVFPEKVLAASSEGLWVHVGRCMGHPQPSVKLAAIKLISLYLADFAQHMKDATLDEPIEGSHGLKLDIVRVEHLVRLGLNILNGHEVDEALAAEAGQVLIFLGPRLPTPAAVVEDEEVAAEGADGDDEDSEDEQPKQKDLQYLFYRLSHILRKEVRPTAIAIHPKTVAIEVLETIIRRSATERIQPSLKTILTPLQNITDPSIRPPQTIDEAFKTKHEHIKTRAQILMDSLQKKFGTAEYTKQLMAIREEVRARRQARASKRKIDAIANPERYGRDKRKKFERNRERKKVRSSEKKQARQAYKNW